MGKVGKKDGTARRSVKCENRAAAGAAPAAAAAAWAELNRA